MYSTQLLHRPRCILWSQRRKNITLTTSPKTNPVKKQARDARDSCLKKTHKWPSDTAKFPALLIISEMRMRTLIMSYHSTPARMAGTKKTRDNKQERKSARAGTGGKGNLAGCWGGGVLISSATGVLTKLQTEWLLGIHPKDWKSAYQRVVYTPVVTAALFAAAPECVPRVEAFRECGVQTQYNVQFYKESATIITKLGGIILNEPNAEH